MIDNDDDKRWFSKFHSQNFKYVFISTHYFKYLFSIFVISGKILALIPHSQFHQLHEVHALTHYIKETLVQDNIPHYLVG